MLTTGLARPLLLVAAGLLFAACTTAGEPPRSASAAAPATKPTATPPTPTAGSAAAFLADVVGKVRDQYVDAVAVEQLGVAALHGLEKVRPSGAIRVLANPRGATLAHGESGSIDSTLAVSWPANPTAADVGRVMEEAGRFVIRRLGTPPVEVTDAMLHGLMTIDSRGSYLGAVAYGEASDRSARAGVGLELAMREGHLTVIEPIEGAPGEKAGLRAGDRIVSIDGGASHGTKLHEAVQRLRGAPGSRVALVVTRAEWDAPREITVTRAAIVASTVHRKAFGPVGYLRIRQLRDDTADDVGGAVRALRAGGARALVLDLRGNTGGLLTAAIEVGELFLPDGRLVTFTEGRVRNQNMRFSAHAKHATLDLPLAILVDGVTASGAEIIAATLRDWGRATIVGTRTAGQVTIQTIIPLANEGGLRLTTARWFTPQRRSLEGVGVTLDADVSPGEGDDRLLHDPARDSQLRRAIEVVTANKTR